MIANIQRCACGKPYRNIPEVLVGEIQQAFTGCGMSGEIFNIAHGMSDDLIWGVALHYPNLKALVDNA
jgi:hypothetical protein